MVEEHEYVAAMNGVCGLCGLGEQDFVHHGVDPEGADPDYPILRFFAYAHLRPDQQQVSRLFHDLAYGMANTLPPGQEVSAGLRKLLEAKDCFVRAAS